MTREETKEYAARWYRQHAKEHNANCARWKKEHAEKVKEASARYRANNAEAVKATKARCRADRPDYYKAVSKQWRRDNPDRAKELVARWVKEHPQQKKASDARWSKSNKDKVAANTTRYRKAHPEKIAGQNSRRRARVLGNGIGDPMLMDRFRKHINAANKIRCYWCRSYVPKGSRQIDHIVPLAKGGSDSELNLCCSCGSCNRRKGAKDPGEFSGQYELPFACTKGIAA